MTGYHKISGGEFFKYHPIVNFIYFIFVFIFSMVITQPIIQIISLICSIICGISFCGKNGLWFAVKYSLPIILLTTVINPLFSHEGITIIMYLPSGNPLTLESILYGLSSGCMLASILLWFMSLNKVITSDKLMYLFGKIVPSLALLISMTMRFIPKFKAQIEIVNEAQKCMGHNVSRNGILSKMRNAITVLSIVVTWSLENAIETADSMKSRGYGLKGRTTFTIYSFGERDKIMLIWLLFSGIYVLCGMIAGVFDWRYYPSISGFSINPFAVSFHIVYFLMCITPVFINIMEEHNWKNIQSKT